MTSTHLKVIAHSLPAACAAVALVTLCSAAHGEELNTVTVVSARTRVVGYEDHGLMPIKESVRKVNVAYAPVTLTTNSGVALLRDAVTQAAFRACAPSGASAELDQSCIRNAINNAQPQIDAAIARANEAENG